MLPIAFGLLIWCPAIIGWGIVTRRVGGYGIARADLDLSDAPAGFLALTVLAVVLNFFVAIGRPVAAAVAITGWSVFAVAYRGNRIAAIGSRAAPAAVAGLVLAFAAAQPVHYGYDPGLYHLQTMQWVEQWRLPPGLANLSGRYGYNSAWLPLATLVRDPFDARFLEHAILLPATMLVFALLAVRRCLALARTSVGAATGAIAVLAIASPTVHAVVNSTAQDIVPLVAWLACTALVIRASECPDEAARRLDDAWRIAAVAVTAKLSAFTLVLLPVAATLRLPAAISMTTGVRLRGWLRFAWLPATAMFCWSLRGVALSGCAAYPAGISCVSALPWAVSAASVKSESRTISAWARQPFVPLELAAPFPHWVPAWFARVSRDTDVQVPVALLVAALGAMFFALRTTAPTRAPPGTGTVFAVIGFAIAAWLVLAPDPRFGAGPLWALGALAAARAGVAASPFAGGWRTWVAPALILVVWFPRAVEMARTVSRPARNPGLATVLGGHRIRIVGPTPVRATLTTAGDTVWVPQGAGDDRCVLAPLPCAPALQPGLMVVRNSKGGIAGFRLEPR